MGDSMTIYLMDDIIFHKKLLYYIYSSRTLTYYIVFQLFAQQGLLLNMKTIMYIYYEQGSVK